VEVLLLLVVSVSIAAAILWLAATPLRRSRGETPDVVEPFEFARPGGPAAPPEFVFRPAPVADDRPPRPRSLILIAAVVIFVAALAAGLAWGLGYVINEQLARLLTE
jgi:preprotein translocase subunit SecE